MDIKTALTYDDVLLVPKKSSITSRQDTDTSTRFSRNINLKIPITSANMDTVTESDMAIAMAQAGGLGIIHRFCSIEIQAKEVAKVKRKQNVIIDEPFTVSPQDTLAQVKDKIKECNCKSFLVAEDKVNGEAREGGLGQDKKLLGVLSNRDYAFIKNEGTLVADMMTPKENLITAPYNINPDAARELLQKKRVEKLPLVDKDFNIRGLITATDILNNYNNINAAKDKKGRLLVGAAIGVREDYMDRVEALIKAEVDVLVLDIAHGHSSNEIEAIAKIRAKYPNVELVGGNIATAEAATDLIKAGVDAVKVGIGPGSICTTRITTGFGVPQLSAIMDITKVCRKHKIPIIADGGIKQSADVVKALAAGADTVMIGGQLAGTKESPGPTITHQGRQYKISRGMASLTAALSRPDAKEKIQEITPEGVEARVPYRGPVQNILNQYVGGLRSGMSYGNAKNLIELRKNAEFIRITGSGMQESGSHDNQLL